MQDNGSWRGPAYVWKEGGIRNSYWQELFFGDGFDVVPDPDDTRYGYAMSQGGYLGRYDLETGRTQFIKPVHPEGKFLRFNWNTGIAQDPFDNATIYYGSQFLHKSVDKGQNWTIISPDLTTNDPEKLKQFDSGGLTYDVTQAENHCTILAIAPSPVGHGVIWVGTDDGNLQLTIDDGKTWENISEKIEEMPRGAWIPQIVPSTFSAGEAFVVVNNYRMDDWTPYLFHTEDYGKSWVNLVKGNKVWGYTLSVVQDPVVPDLLFLGTEFGLYFSMDKGSSWIKWGKTYPTVSTMDLKIHPREHDLIIGTFGRAAYIVDDIRPIQEMAGQGLAPANVGLHVFEPPTAYLASIQQASGSRFAGYSIFSGENRPFDGMITYYLKSLKFDTVEVNKVKRVEELEKDSLWVEIYNDRNEQIRRFKVETKKGFNRFIWDLQRKGARLPSAAKPKSKEVSDPPGPNVLPGKYKVKITYGDYADSTEILVKLDPRIEFDLEAMKVVDGRKDKAIELVSKVTSKVDQLNEIKESIGLVEKMLTEDDVSKEIRSRTELAKDTIKYFMSLINNPEDIQGIRTSPDLISYRLNLLNNYLVSAIDKPNHTQEMIFTQTEQAVEQVLGKIDAWMKEDWVKTEELIEDAQLSPFSKWDKKD
jgi:hypothetical protein